MNAFTLAVIVGALFLSSISVSIAQTSNVVNGVISSNITLTKANGPYTFQQVVVKQGATLTIEPGASISIDGYLQVSGTLNAKGTSSQQIFFNFGGYFGGSIKFDSTSTSSIIENAIVNYVPVNISGSVTIRNSYLRGSQDQASISIDGGSPTITDNTIFGTLDADTVIYVTGGSPIITNNKIGASSIIGLYPNPPVGMNRFGSAYGVHVTNANGGQVTNNKFFGAYRSNSVQVDAGTITVNDNTEDANTSIVFPTPTPPPATPTPTPSPTLPPYPPPSEAPTSTPTANSTISTTPAGTGGSNFYELAASAIVASVIINIVLVTIAVVVLRNNKKTLAKD